MTFEMIDCSDFHLFKLLQRILRSGAYRCIPANSVKDKKV